MSDISEASKLSASESKPFLSPDEQHSIDLEDGQRPTLKGQPPRPAWKTPIEFLSIFILALLIGLLFGRYRGPPSHKAGLLLPTGHNKQVWQHNFTFSQAPTRESEDAWDSIVPVGRGFVTHPELAPFVSNIAVFHQLHCLHAILVGYYDYEYKFHAVLNGSDPYDDKNLFGTRIEKKHIRHCFDYLRRAVMCSVDTNLEILDPVNFTTTGWGDLKYCRNYDEVFEFAEKWANSSDTGVVT